MKFWLPFLFSLLAVDAFEIVAPESSLKEWAHQAAIERAKGFTKDLKPGLSTRIIGGADAPTGRYPYYTYVEVLTVESDVFICSATLIWEDIILTAAHCVLDILGAGLNISGVEAYIGLEDQNGRNSSIFRQVGQGAPHPDYTPGTEFNDIMLFQLQNPVLDVAPVRLNFDPVVPADGVALEAFGFGATSTDPNVPLPDILQSVSLVAIPFADCNDAESYDGVLNVTVHMCAAVPDGGKDACDGDSGSPLIILGATAADDIQVGLASFGEGCGNANFPGVYTRISSYETFILDQVCLLSANKPIECDNTTAVPTTVAPTLSLTSSPTSAPTAAPTSSPTSAPTSAPTFSPTSAPTSAPTSVPTSAPTLAPTSVPTTSQPTSGAPNSSPTLGATTPVPTELQPIAPVSPVASFSPVDDSSSPSVEPSIAPTLRPTLGAASSGVPIILGGMANIGKMNGLKGMKVVGGVVGGGGNKGGGVMIVMGGMKGEGVVNAMGVTHAINPRFKLIV